MGLEINQADGEIVEAIQDAGNSGNTGVPTDPPVAPPLTSLRPAMSLPLPSELQSDNRELIVRRPTASRPASWSSWGVKILKKLTWGKDPRPDSNGEVDRPEVIPSDPTRGEETFRWSSPWVDPGKVYGFEEELQALESFVRREKDGGGFRAVGVIGAGGIGKTTLCQLLFNEKGIKEEFAPRIWVSNSRLPAEDKDLKTAIVRRMLVQIGEDLRDDMGLDQLVPLLHRNLWGKKYLIVLDDARDADRWYYKLGAMPNMEDKWKDHLAYGLPKGSGGRVVVTGRNEEVARKMVGEDNVHKVMPLSDPGCCWQIFEESVWAGQDEAANSGMNVEAMKKEVYEKSAGIPMAVKIMGEIMKEQLHKAKDVIIQRTATA